MLDADDNVLPSVQERFIAAYAPAGGEIELEIFPGCDHRPAQGIVHGVLPGGTHRRCQASPLEYQLDASNGICGMQSAIP